MKQITSPNNEKECSQCFFIKCNRSH